MSRPLRDGHLVHVSYNRWEILFLIDLLILTSVQSTISTQEDWPYLLEPISIMLFALPSLSILFACVFNQCFTKRGGYSRVYNFSVYRWWRARSAHTRSRAETELSIRAFDNMMAAAREPMIVDEMRLNLN